MPLYPQLSLNQQQFLPTLIKATQWPAQYEDSTHQLWHCDTVAGEYMLKVCNSNSVTRSFFWQGMLHLFDVQLPAQLGLFKTVYNTVEQLGTLCIPNYIASTSANKTNNEPAFILTKMMIGYGIAVNDINDGMVKALAQHISQLHLAQQPLWGKAVQPEFALNDWSKRLQITLKILAKQQAIPNSLLDEALAQAKDITVNFTVPIMLDLRWDQFLQQEGRLTTLVDLDAFAYAPRELELVLLEIILNGQQAKLFIKHYQQQHLLPDLSSVRTVYRLLLFLMNVLGEKNINIWMLHA